MSNSDRLGLLSLGRKRGLDAKDLEGLSPQELAEKVAGAKGGGGLGGKFLNPKRAADALARANAAADPRKGRGGAAADPQQKALDSVLAVVREINTTFANLATA